MAVTTQKTTEYGNATAAPAVNNSPAEMGGRLRIAYGVHDQSGAGDATSSVALFRLPAGRVRVLLGLSFFYVNWTTASATLDLGWDAYTKLDGSTEAADPDGLIDGLDVDTAGKYSGEDLVSALTQSAGGTQLFESKDGIVIRATSQDVALADGSDIAGYLVYVVD
ncbi:MAG: hypothetical protein H6883_08120 [Rhodobiaceae bacterium]|nr:hypothetical protein [Rhodobiaceae bacterium]MCC0056088.1 hypothetical protein [Rhodobiaceae bacterium]